MSCTGIFPLWSPDSSGGEGVEQWVNSDVEQDLTELVSSVEGPIDAY